MLPLLQLLGRLGKPLSRQHACNAEPDHELLKVKPGILQVVSGLAKHMTLEELQGRRVVIVANLKPANMRKVLSQAMVLAATAPDGSKVGPRSRACTLACCLPGAARCACLLFRRQRCTADCGQCYVISKEACRVKADWQPHMRCSSPLCQF